METRKVNCVDASGRILPAWRCSRLRTRSRRRECQVRIISRHKEEGVPGRGYIKKSTR